MRRVCSDDSVLRAVGRMEKQEAERWLRRHLSPAVRPQLQEPWVLDIDTTVKPVYGHQEGAEIGCNPLRKGRPSMAIHTYQMGVTRLVLEVDVEAGNRNHSKYGLPGLGRLLEELREEVGVEVSQRSGSRVLLKKEVDRMVVHRPHPEKETGRATVRDIAAFLESIGVSP